MILILVHTVYQNDVPHKAQPVFPFEGEVSRETLRGGMLFGDYGNMPRVARFLPFAFDR
jgi:hypothetical protein